MTTATIKLFLPHGDAKRLRVGEVSNWTGKLVHLETSWDALPWEAREARYLTKKFVFTFDQYAEIIGSTPATIQKRAIIGTSRSQPKAIWGEDIEVTTVPNFIAEIAAEMKLRHPMRDVIPETYPCLRSFQFALAYGG